MANEFVARNGLISLSTVTTSNSGINIGTSTTSIISDGSSIFIKASGNTYLNTANNAYVSAVGVIYGTGFSGPGTSLTGTAASLSIGGKSDGAIKLWSVSHPNDFYISNTWDGTYWQLTSNHSSSVNVAHATSADYATSAGSATDSSKLPLAGGTITGNIVASNYGIGNVGLYSATNYQNIFSMGTSYVPSADGTTLSNMYGLAWTHSNIGGQSKSGLSHQMLVVEAGVTKTAIGTGIWTSGVVTATNFSGNWNGYTYSASSGANTMVQRDGSGYISNNYFYTSGGGSERSASGMSYFAGFNSSDYYIRSYTPAAVASAIGLSNYLPLAGGTMTSQILFTNALAAAADSTPSALSFGRVQTFGNLHLNADTDASGTEYIFLTSGYGTGSSNATNGLAIGQATITWKNNALIHAGNIGSQSVDYATSSGSAGSVAWGNITGKEAWLTTSSLVASHTDANSWKNSGFYENDGGGSNWPSLTWYNSINVRHSNQGNYHGFQIAMSFYDNLLWHRSYQGAGTFQSWVYGIHSGNIGSQSVDYATSSGSAGSVAWGNVSGRPTAVSSFTNDSGYTTNTGTVTGTGLSNYIAKWSGTSALTYSSAIYEDGTQAAISSPIIRLSSSQIFIGLSGSSTTTIGDFDGGGTTAIIAVNGTLRVKQDVIAYYSSDKRLKDNIVPITNALDKISKIGGYEFDWNSNQDTYTGHDVGVIAQEIEEVLPELVIDRENGYKAVKYEKIVALLIEGMKDQQKLIENQQKQIDSLLNK